MPVFCLLTVSLRIYPNVAKAGELQSQDAEGTAVVHLLQALGNAGSGVLRLLQHWGLFTAPIFPGSCFDPGPHRQITASVRKFRPFLFLLQDNLYDPGRRRAGG
jgi:hypothetical protein